jgi:potassium-dependent mechanosensitive channel
MAFRLKNSSNIFYLVFFIIFNILTSISFAQSAVDTLSVDGIRASLQQIEATLERKDLSDKELLDLRTRVEPLVENLKEYIAKQTPKLEGLKARVEQLTPKDSATKELVPKDAVKGETKPDAPEPDIKTPSVSESLSLVKEREDQARILKETDANLRSARYEAERGQQLLNTISERRRVLFTRALLDRSQSLISPTLWLDIAQILPNEMRLIGRFFGEWWGSAYQNLDLWRVFILAGFIVTLLILAPRVLRFIYKFEGRSKTITTPTRLLKAITALRIIFGATIAPALICFLSYFVIKSLGLISGRIDDLGLSLSFGISFLFFARAMNRAIIPATEPNWRIFNMRDELAAKLQWVVASVSLTLIIGKMVEALFHAIVAPLTIIIAIKGVIAVIVAAIIVQALRSLTVETIPVLDEDCFGPNTSIEPEKANWFRIAGWVFCAIILLATATGFIAFASFLSTQIVWVVTVIILLMLALIIIDEVIGRGMSSEGLLGRRMKNSVGLKTGSIDQISIISSGLLRLTVFFIALFLVLAPWGVDSGDLTGYLKSAFFGFSVAGVTISFSTIASALIIFILGVTLTRSIQRWLDLRYLPFTGLDVGLRNSIKTIFGYVGILIASALAFSAAGLSLDKLTIVAGALSVGIGFGLQSIVNNFVSGLILLWERPLRVGDWIAVGGEEGIVKRINVRATEIETFDKASLIVPNSEFISGRVKNWVHSNHQARIIIPISVKNSTDPKRIEAILSEVALAHREVLSQPAPRVLFMKITDSSLDFELRCIVDVDVMAITRSELLFALYARLQTEGIDMPMTTRTVEIADMDKLGSAIAASMAVVDKKEV